MGPRCCDSDMPIEKKVGPPLNFSAYRQGRCPIRNPKSLDSTKQWHHVGPIRYAYLRQPAFELSRATWGSLTPQSDLWEVEAIIIDDRATSTTLCATSQEPYSCQTSKLSNQTHQTVTNHGRGDLRERLPLHPRVTARQTVARPCRGPEELPLAGACKITP